MFVRFRMRLASFVAGLALLAPASLFAAGNAPQPNICTRACWGASSGSTSYMSALTRAIVHHTAGSEFNTSGLEASKANVRAIQSYHKGLGWGDIGYHFMIDKFGNIFEGRVGSMGSLPRGAHDAANTNSFGFTCLGYFHPNVNNIPTAAMLDSLYDVIAWRMPNGWSPYGSPGGSYGNLGNTVGRVDGHRRVVATACPGDHIFNVYMGTNLNGGAIRDEIQARINGGPPGGPPVTTLAGWYRIVTQFGNKVFDVANSSMDDGGNIQQWGWNGTANQVFIFEHLGDGYYKITNKNSGKVMDVSGPSTADGANIHQYTWNNTDNQKWRVEDMGGGNVRLVAKHSGKVADVTSQGATDGTNIQQWTWNGTNAQLFRLENVPVPISNLSGDYRLIKKGTDDKALDLTGGGLADGVELQLYHTNASDPQVWNFEIQADGYYKITSRVSGKVIDVAGPSTADGANIHQWAWNGTDNQRWSAQDLGDGYVRLVAKHSGKVLDVDNNGTADGTNIHQWTWNGGNAQRWKVEPVGAPDATLAGAYTITCKAGGNALDVANSGTANGTNIQIYTPNATIAQKFSFEHLGAGYYKIVCDVSGQVVDVAGPSAANAANIHTWPWSNTENQKWRAEVMEDGSYRFLSQYSGKAMDASATAAGSNVHQYAWHGGDNQRWNLAPIAPPTPPAAPNGLSATAINGSQINLAWTDNANNESNVIVSRSATAGGPYTDIATLAANVTSYNNTGLTANTTYYYVVRATNAGGPSANSNEASANTLVNPPAAPSGLSASASGTSQINLSWADNSSDEDNFVVARSTTSGGPYTDIATLGANVTSYNNTGLSAATTYYYVVRGTNAGGSSANSAQASATTLPNPPSTPSGLSASGVSASQVNLSWTDTSSNESNFVVARSSTAGGPYADIATLGANVTSYNNTGLAANTTYYYVVRATNAGGASGNSNEAAGVTWPNEIIIDNNSGSFTASANWSTGTSAADKFGADYRFRPTAAISDQAVWNITVPQSRNYEIYAWWAQGANRATAAAYTLPDNATVAVNQQAGGGAWNSLGTKSLSAGAATVKLSCWTTTGFVVVADGVRLVPR